MSIEDRINLPEEKAPAGPASVRQQQGGTKIRRTPVAAAHPMTPRYQVPVFRRKAGGRVRRMTHVLAGGADASPFAGLRS